MTEPYALASGELRAITLIVTVDMDRSQACWQPEASAYGSPTYVDVGKKMTLSK